MKFRYYLAFLLVTGVALFTIACGDEDGGCDADSDCKGDRICESSQCVSPDGDSDDSNDSNSSNSSNDSNSSNSSNDSNSSEEAHCCLNGEYYDCPTGDDAEACFDNFEPGDCSRDSGMDGECDDGGNNDSNDSNGGGGGGGGGDMGDPCSSDSDCDTDGCIYESSGDVEGFCSDTCDDFSDCPSLWDCEEVDGSSHKYCIED